MSKHEQFDWFAARRLADELYDIFEFGETRNLKNQKVSDRSPMTVKDMVELAADERFGSGVDAPEGCVWFVTAPHSWAINQNRASAIAAAISNAAYWRESNKVVQAVLVPDVDLRVSQMDGSPSWSESTPGYDKLVEEKGVPRWRPFHYNGKPFSDEEVEKLKAELAEQRTG